MIVVFRAMLPPASQLFSTMQTSVIPCREAREYAVESPCPPPPTITTSYEAFGSAARQYRTSPIANERFRDGRSRVNRSSLGAVRPGSRRSAGGSALDGRHGDLRARRVPGGVERPGHDGERPGLALRGRPLARPRGLRQRALHRAVDLE